MKHLLTSTIFVFAISCGFTQELLPLFSDTVFEKNEFQISTFNYYSSNTFNNELTDKFIFGGTITEDLKTRNANKLSGSNVLGAEAEQSITFYNKDIKLFKNPNFGFVASFSDNHFLTANVPTDLFNLGMYGNANYLGDTMRFQGAMMEYLHFQKMGFGFFHKKTMSSIQVSFFAGSKEVNMNLNNSYMLSEEDSVQLKLLGLGSYSNEFSPYFGFQGSGFSIDMNYNLLFENKKGNLQIVNLKLNNLGVIFWNQSSNRVYIDSNISYDGFDVNRLLNEENDVYNFKDTIGILTKQDNYYTSLPIEFVLQKIPDLKSHQKFQLIGGFKTILTSAYFPYIFAGGFYKPTDHIAISSRLSYGGFGGLKWG